MKPDVLRTAHLEHLQGPMLVVQGERDPFGSREEVERLRLSNAIRFHWAHDGDHDLGPRGASGTTHKGNLMEAADAVVRFAAELSARGS
jgi:predicted alpha/beta-hydrolase family hydrolase